jgi:hypothetical protein
VRVDHFKAKNLKEFLTQIACDPELTGAVVITLHADGEAGFASLNLSAPEECFLLQIFQSALQKRFLTNVSESGC